MSKRACNTSNNTSNTSNKKHHKLNRSYAFYCPRGYEQHFDVYKHEHQILWSRIEAGFGIYVDDNGADEFYVSVAVHKAYTISEDKWHCFKMADWGVHTNYPRDPLDFEDF